ncbi:DEAD/DEAH box helicase [Cytobacillus sp. IB215316]|uniref:DEAD/DEAH box helicase n=1 Tax=Cytobacillus sp. IB215316 TaxID=3097354 RepID=UPI002A17F80C|nr:DEAD/DEAH box helicase [Cytobacillus sp. IB215316]MDX8361758.1 DEAD/DEAH box helicase [Cytobacillus sp. IB215316]
MQDFLSLNLSDTLINTLTNEGIVQPTPIQERAIPKILDNKDVIAQAQTGTGKTIAFMLPILEKIDTRKGHIQALIVTPTRELALQITAELEKFIADVEGVHALAVYGGQEVDKQLKKLKQNTQIVVGTPGRLLDHIKRKTIDLSTIDILVLDEADQMLNIGFLTEVEEIIKETPDKRQTLLFSATIPTEIKKLASKYMHDPTYIQVEKIQGPADNVKQIAIHTIDRAKQATLFHLIDTRRPYLAVIFCRTKRRVSKLYDILKSKGYLCDELHGDLSQAKREQVMKRFRDVQLQLLIATDVAARGLDVEGVTHVFNYDIPQDAESYVHRIGRTGRAGMPGEAITFYSSNDRPVLDMIEKDLNIKIEKQNVGKITKNEDKGKKKNYKSNRTNKNKYSRQDSKDESNSKSTTKSNKQSSRSRQSQKTHNDESGSTFKGSRNSSKTSSNKKLHRKKNVKKKATQKGRRK